MRDVKSWLNVTKAVAARQRPKEFLGQLRQLRKLLQAVRRVPVLERKVSRVYGTEEGYGDERGIMDAERLARQAQVVGGRAGNHQLGLESSDVGREC